MTTPRRATPPCAAVLADLAARYPAATFVVGLEASGGLERNWLRFFRKNPHTAAGKLYRLNPLAVRRFLERELHRSGTDTSSAQGIAAYLHTGLAPGRSALRPGVRRDRGLLPLRLQQHRSPDPAPERAAMPAARGPPGAWCSMPAPAAPTGCSACSKSIRPAPAWPGRGRRRSRGFPYLTRARAAALRTAAQQSVASLRDDYTGRAVAFLAREIRRLGTQIDRDKAALIATLHEDPVVRRLETIVGIGWWTAVVLRLEIGHFDRFPSADALVAYAGLDPSYHQSGDGLVQLRISKRGRAEIRAVLYMNVLTAIQHNPAIRAFYQRLVGRGKLSAVALTACMAKLLRIAYACVLQEQDFDRERYLARPGGAGARRRPRPTPRHPSRPAPGRRPPGTGGSGAPPRRGDRPGDPAGGPAAPSSRRARRPANRTRTRSRGCCARRYVTGAPAECQVAPDPGKKALTLIGVSPGQTARHRCSPKPGAAAEFANKLYASASLQLSALPTA